MFVAVYWWRVKPGMEAQFRDGWRRATAAIMEKHGGLGSRLHLAADGRYIAYAQWPDEASWRKFFDDPVPADPQASARFRDAILESGGEPFLKMDMLDDFLLSPP